jgi:hypothetical protein
LLLSWLQITFEVRHGTALVAATTCATDASGRCKAAIPASLTVATYNVVASALCGSSPISSSPAQVDWVAVPGQLLLAIPQPLLPVNQSGALEATLLCGGATTPGSTGGQGCLKALHADRQIFWFVSVEAVQ